jgi:S1-C subfamily serine protease
MDNLFKFDNTLHQNVDQEVNLVIYRRGKKLKIKLKVLDGESFKIKKFILFAGGTFHEITPFLKYYWDIVDQGIYLSQAEVGSTMNLVGRSSKKVRDRKGVVLTAIDGHPVTNLDTFIELIKNYKGEEYITVSFKDYYYTTPIELKLLTLNLKLNPTLVFDYNSKKLDWQNKTSTRLAK